MVAAHADICEDSEEPTALVVQQQIGPASSGVLLRGVLFAEENSALHVGSDSPLPAPALSSNVIELKHIFLL